MTFQWRMGLAEGIDVFLSTRTLKDLQTRPKNQENFDEAQRITDELKTLAPIILSTIIVDTNGEILFIYLGWRLKVCSVLSLYFLSAEPYLRKSTAQKSRPYPLKAPRRSNNVSLANGF